MKKFAFGLLSVFMIIGGMFLTACGNDVSMSVSTQEVVIYTNDSQKANNKEKEIEVSLENSSSGIDAEIISGEDCIRIEKTNTTKPKANGKYAFKILTKDNNASGTAQIYVYPIEDRSKGKMIDILVNTVLEGIILANTDNENARSNSYVVRGVEKALSAEEYFTFNPITANVKDIDWEFEASETKEYVVDGVTLARIEDSKLIVSEQYLYDKVSLIAFSKDNTSVRNIISLDVLSNSTIKEFEIDGNKFYENGILKINGASINLKRNNAEVSIAQGNLVVNSAYDFDLDIEAFVYETNGDRKYMTKKEYSKYFNFDILDENSGSPANTHTYQFNIDAYDYLDNGLTGNVNVVFSINYRNYNYSVLTDNISIVLKEGYSATRVDVLDENGNSINNEVVDVFSSYEGKAGYLIQTIVQPENRAIDNSNVRFVVDINQEALSSKTLDTANPVDDIFIMTYKGRKLNFTRSGSLYVSEDVVSGADVYVRAVGNFENFILNVQALSNTNIATDIFMNLYEISTDGNLIVTNLDGSDLLKTVYMSSGLLAPRSATFDFRISGISSAVGLSLEKIGSENFDFSSLEVVEINDSATVSEKYIIVRFSVNLTLSKFNEKASFKFVHLTGKESDSVEIEAFVPLESAYVQNVDSSLADVYFELYKTMGYALSEEGQVVISEKTNNSLAKLIVEAGSSLSVSTETANAKLSQDAVKFKFLSYSDFADAIATYGLTEEAERVFNEADFDVILPLYTYFVDATTRPEFAISSQKLRVEDSTFKGIVAVEVHGFDDEHRDVVFVRFFTLESVYSVRYLKSNVEPKTLYTTETLSQADMGMSYVDVTLELRPDEKTPTYSGDIERLSFVSASTTWDKIEERFLQNKYYMVSDISFKQSGKQIAFRITANSTNMQTSFNDVLSIYYKDVNDILKKTEISIEIKNVRRIESVEWLNKPADGKIYLNLTSASRSEKEFTISTSVLPASAHDIRLIHSYIATSGADSYLNVVTSEVGQTINVNIATQEGGNGFLYLLPADMVKVVDGTDSILLYKYGEVDGEITETPIYSVNLSDINSRYDEIVGGKGNEFDTYFINNDGNKVYYRDIILKIEIVIADGKSEKTAIRVYNQGDLEGIDSSLYYEIVNDISFTGWKGIPEFKGGIEGNGKTLKFNESDAQGANKNFINKLSGKLSNINFVGVVNSANGTNGGFIADTVEKTGVIENCSIDVYYDGQTYKPSLLNAVAQAYTGTIAGKNEGLISNVKVYGLSISSGSNSVGGLVGNNLGRIFGCGYELYDFDNGNSTSLSYGANQRVNKFGGLVGETGSGSSVLNSYIFNFSDNEIEAVSSVKAFVCDADNSSFEKSFAYLGNRYAAFNHNIDIYTKKNSTVVVDIKNCYVTYMNAEGDHFAVLYNSYGENSASGSIAVDVNIWEKDPQNLDEGVNFGFPYLKEILPSAVVDLESLRIQNVDGKSVYAGDAENEENTYNGVLFLYRTIQSLTTDQQRSELDLYNTISVSELFGITPEQAKSLLLTSTNTNVVIDSDKIKVVGETFEPFTISVHLKMDYSETQDFNFVIVNALPTLNATIAGETYVNGQIVMLQTTKTKNVVYNIESKVSLNGTIFALQKDSYNIEIDNVANTYVSAIKSGNIVVLNGLTAHNSEVYSRINTYLSVVDLNAEFNNYLKISQLLDVRVFNGTTGFVVNNANGLIVNASSYATFEVFMTSDNENDNLQITLSHGEIEISGTGNENKKVFEVDENLVLEAIWAKSKISQNYYKFDVVVKILDEKRHLIDKNYDNLKLLVNAESQKNSTEYLRTIDLFVETLGAQDVSISVYEIYSRVIRNNKLYFNRSQNLITTLTPSSDAILAVTIDPAYANMDYFTLTYASAGSGNAGTINISRLGHNSDGYYINSESTTSIANGVRVALTENDKKGDGVFYFRIYISSAFSGEVDLKFSVSVYGNGTTLSGSHDVSVSALREATVKVEGKSNYLLAKGQSAQVEIIVGESQVLYDLHLQNNGSGIFMTAPTYDEVAKSYTATLNAGINAQLADGEESGVFYVCATVERVLNGVQEFKTTYATVYLVDFAVDADQTHVGSSNKTATYNGKTYDVFTSYINDSQTLYFDYTLLPESYSYDHSSRSDIEKAQALEEKKLSFLKNNYYADQNSNYYINYLFNESRGVYEAVELKNQLWYATDEEHMTKVYNATYDRLTQSDYFGIAEIVQSNGLKSIQITGKRSGTQLMMLRTTVVYMGQEFVYDYYFLIRVEIYTDEDSPKTIRTAQEFIEVTLEEDAADYILMNDIVLDEYSPISTEMFNSLDGNGYTIHVNSFAKPENSNQIRFALFDTVEENSTIKNVKVNWYGGGQISLDINTYTDVVVAGFAITNDGVIYNCEVVSYYDENYQTSKHSNSNGIVVKYTNGEGMDEVLINSKTGLESTIVGFVYENTQNGDIYASISNCRVGGEEISHFVDVAGVSYRQRISLETFLIQGQGNISGFVAQNDGYVSASYVKNIQINNKFDSTSSITAGFVLTNNYNLQNNYVEGLGGEYDTDSGAVIPYNQLTSIDAMGTVAGFVYENNGLVKNSYSNIAIENAMTSAGFVYRNNASAVVTLSYSACKIDSNRIGQMEFSGVDGFARSLNNGQISLCYYYKDSRLENFSNESKISSGAIGIKEVFDEDSFYGFSFNSSNGSYDGIWQMSESGISLVSADKIALSNRYARTIANVESVFYNKSTRDLQTLELIDISYGSENNPIIIRNAADFAKATGKATAKEISSYKEYYNDSEVYGNYRLVGNVVMSQIAQNEDENNLVKLTTTSKIFRGILDGNGFVISNISLGGVDSVENFGLFSKLDSAVIMNLDLIVESVHNTEANIVGTLAGTALDTRILSVHLEPVSVSGGSSHTAVQGNNIVGGVVGMVLGSSYLCDITIENIDVESVYRMSSKTIDTNKQNVRQIRQNININLPNSVKQVVSILSYAGSVVGLVDIYASETVEYARYAENLTVKDFNVVSIDVSGAVNLYGEVVGGVFGYVGTSTYVYDATINLGPEKSHIISKNLFAGGIVGENYGALHAVSASYDKQTQSRIEASAYSYYNGSISSDMGQQTIFSYEENEEGSYDRINNPLFIGGIAGYMGGGFIYVANNKLNVVSTKSNTLAVGGIVGLLGLSDVYYSLKIITPSKDVNYMFRDIYSSGNVYAANGTASGIIGSIEKRNEKTSDIAFINVMALNLLSYNIINSEGVLSGGNDNHFMIMGNIYNKKNDASWEILGKDSSIMSNVYIIDNLMNVAYNLKTKELRTDSGSYAVGGYSKYYTSNNETPIEIAAYGFSAENKALICDGSIGNKSLSEMSYAYARNYSYFIGNGWSEKFWAHEQDTLFPYIELTPKLDVVFWDVYDKENILELMKNSTITVVVRGRLSESINNEACADIDFTDLNDIENVNFRGKLYSYSKYMGTLEGGRVTQKNAKYSKASAVGDEAGIIISKSLFSSISNSALIDGVKFFVVDGNSFGGIVNTIEDSVVRNVQINVIGNVKMNAQAQGTSENRQNSTGILAQSVVSSSIINLNINFDDNVSNVSLATYSGVGDSYLGLVAGYIEQKSKFSNATIQNININTAVSSDDSFEIKVLNNSQNNVYLGLYSGNIVKTVGARIEVVLKEIVSNFKFSVTSETATIQNLVAGGYVGQISNIDGFNFERQEEISSIAYGFTFVQDAGISNLVQGAFIGKLNGGNYVISGAGEKVVGVVEKNGEGTENAKIGGFVGLVDGATLNISGFEFSLNLGKQNEAYQLTSSSVDNAVGGVVGYAKSNSITISNCPKFEGEISVVSPYINVGGLIGKATTNVSIVGNITNNISIYAESTNTANIGGAVGSFNAAEQTKLECEAGFASAYYRYVSEIVTKATNVYAGGYAGVVSGTANINNFVFGGEYTHLAQVDNVLTIGGVVGKISGAENIIANCFSYADVYVEYDGIKTLKDYYFGGIAGRANNVEIKNCVSMLTNFNAREVYVTESSKVAKPFSSVGAIVGESFVLQGEEEHGVTFDGNYYSSGVNLAYQQESGNTDLAYNNAENNNYFGYVKEAEICTTSQKNGILTKISSFVDSASRGDLGEKLNPKYVDSDVTFESGKWNSVSAEFEISTVISNKLQNNTVLVGNGLTITRKTYDTSSESHPNGGLFSEIDGGVVSNLVVLIDVEEKVASQFGGVAGKMSGDSIIYGVGINGTISIGGTAQINVGGLVGVMNGGFVNESYFAGDLVYRGKAGGSIAGAVAVISSGYSTIANTYTSGMITPYVSCDSFEFVQITIPTDETSIWVNLFDSYSLLQIDNSKITSETKQNIKSIIYFKDDSSTLKDKTYIKSNLRIDRKSLDFSAVEEDEEKSKIVYEFDPSSAQNDTNNPWYFDIKTNYGYATHGFGFLRRAQLTIYVRVKDNDLSAENYTIYQYTKALNGTFYEIPNIEKYEQMLTSGTIYEEGDENPLMTATGNYFLSRDLDVSKATENSIGSVIGESFVFDGNEHTLSGYKSASGLFNSISQASAIYNLKLVNATISSSSQELTVGILVNQNYGELNNIYVQGNISGAFSCVGGVVGNNTAGNDNNNSGKMTLIESVVNITNTSAGTSGGVVGKSTGTISYAVSNGIINNTATTGEINNLTVNDSKKLTSIQGGIVGILGGGSVSNSYNANSVLGNYTADGETASTVSGGIVGYASGGSISECANVGLVGAGNYEVTTGYSYAGGIVGYGAINVSASVNNGAVQALGKVDSTKSKIVIENSSGEENVEYTFLPESLVENVTITYNDGLNRQVFAFGIGYNANASDCTTSSDNIKNDGVVGAQTNTVTLIFDRKAILGNDSKFDNDDDGHHDNDYAFFGEFALQESFTNCLISTESALGEKHAYAISGKDSYGFTSRIYMVDRIKRKYGGETNDLVDALNETPNDLENKSSAILSVENGAVGDYQDSGNSYDLGFVDNSSHSDALYGVGNEVKYSSSAAFGGYESILDTINLNSLNESANSDIDVDEKIKVVDAEFESNHLSKTISVDGRGVTTVYTSGQYNAAIAPYKVSVNATFNNIPADARNLRFEIVETNGKEWAIMERENYDTSTHVKSYTLCYPNAETNLNFKISAVYDIDRHTTELRLDNISENVVYDIENNIDEYIINSLGRDRAQAEEPSITYYDSYKIYVGESQVQGTLSWNDDKKCAQIEMGESFDMDTLTGKTLKLVFTTHYNIEEGIKVEYSSTTGQSTAVDEILSGIITKEYAAYESKNISDYEALRNAWSSNQVNLSAVLTALGNPSKAVIGKMVSESTQVEFSVAYENGTWSVKTGSGISISGNLLTGVTYEQYSSWKAYYNQAPTPEVGEEIEIDDIILGDGFRARFSDVTLENYTQEDSDQTETVLGVDFRTVRYVYTIDAATGEMTVTYQLIGSRGYTLTVGNNVYQGVATGNPTDPIYEGPIPNKLSLYYSATNNNLQASQSIKVGENKYQFEFYMLTNDSSPVINEQYVFKKYYKYEHGQYILIENPSGKNPKSNGWYEVVNFNITRGVETDQTTFDGVSLKDVAYTTIHGNYYLYENGWRKTYKIIDIESEAYVYVSNEDASKIWRAPLNQNGTIGAWQSVIIDETTYASVFENDVDLIVKIVGNDVFFIKNNIGNLILTNSIVSTKNDGSTEIEVEVVNEGKTSYTIDDACAIKNTAVYDDERLDYNEETGVLSLKDTIENHTAQTYDYTVTCSREEIITGSTQNPSGAGNDIMAIILGDNIRTQSVSTNKTIIGNSNMLKVSSGSYSILRNSTGTFKDLTAVGILSFKTASGTKSLLIDANTAKISNVTVIGSMRNVKATSVTIKPVSNGEIVKTTTENGTTTYGLNDSYITVTVLDNKLTGGSVSTKIIENFNSKNILISGDAANGRNGRDGILSNNDLNRDGGVGGSGGTGGRVTKTDTEKDNYLFARDGANGKNGYGGNGVSGQQSTIKSPKNGGKAGNAYAQQDDSELINARVIDKDVYKGNSGIDSFAKIIASEKTIYTISGTKTWSSVTASDSNKYSLFGVENIDKWSDLVTKMYGSVYVPAEIGFWAFLTPWAVGIAAIFDRDYAYQIGENGATLKNDFVMAYNNASATGKYYYQTRESVDYWGGYGNYKNVLFRDYSYINSIEIGFTAATKVE